MEEMNPIETIDDALGHVRYVHDFYSAFSFRSPDDDTPYDPRPFWAIPKSEMTVTPPNRWQGIASHFVTNQKIPNTPLKTQITNLLAGLSCNMPVDKAEGVRVLEAVMENLAAVRAAISDLIKNNPPLPYQNADGVFPRGHALNATTALWGGTASQRLGGMDEEGLLTHLNEGHQGRVFVLKGSRLPYSTVGAYTYKTTELAQAGYRNKLISLVDVKGFSNGGVPDAMAADMVQLLCRDNEPARTLIKLLNPIVSYTPDAD